MSQCATFKLFWQTEREVANARIEVTLGAQGRLVIPAPLRKELGIDTGDVLAASIQRDRLVLEPRSAVLARLRERAGAVPRGVSMVDELIAERRREAKRERRK